MSQEPGPFPLVSERLSRRLLERYQRPLPPEGFEGPRTMEDLPLYRMARRVWKATRRFRAREFPRRMMEPPPDLGRRLEHKTPQFFLRNIPRVERSVEDKPEFTVVQVRDRQAERVITDLRSLRYEPPAFLTEWNLDKVMELRALLRRLFFEEDWTRRFGRELKERVRGPLFRYDPDAPQE